MARNSRGGVRIGSVRGRSKLLGKRDPLLGKFLAPKIDASPFRAVTQGKVDRTRDAAGNGRISTAGGPAGATDVATTFPALAGTVEDRLDPLVTEPSSREPRSDPRGMVHVIVIPGHPPTPNARPGHWAKRAEAVEEWRTIGKAYGHDFLTAFGPFEPIELCEIEYVFIVPTRLPRDLDNLTAACKPILDGLVDARILRGDSDRYVRRLSASTNYQKGARFVQVRIGVVR